MAEPRDASALKAENRKIVLDLFRSSPVMTIAEAADACGLSRPTVRRVTDFLKKKRLLLPSGKGDSTEEGGKKPLLLAFNAAYRHILCFQILADGLLSGVCDLRGRLLAEMSVAFPENTPLDAILGHMRRTGEAMREDLRLRPVDFAGVVLGCHGVTDSAAGVISSSPYYPSWGEDIPIKRLTKALFDSSLPVFIDNWNRFDAYAEMRVGKARGCADFITIDGETDGLGGGLVMDGVLWRGNQYLAGEIGHMVVDASGALPCTCGGRGCLQTVACMKKLEEDARRGFDKNRASLLFLRRPPAEVSHIEIYAAANAGDPFARELVDEQARWLGIGIVNVAMVADPARVLLLGPYAKGGPYLIESLKRHLETLTMPRLKKKVEIVCSSFGRERGLVGAAHFVADAYLAEPSL